MIVVVTGMVGIDKKRYLEGVCSLAKEAGRDVELCNVGDAMYAEAPDIAAGRILDIPLKRLHGLRRSVFKDIIARAGKCENLIVNTHATFRWRHGLFPAFDFDHIRQLNPDMYVCLIDGVGALHVRLDREHTIRHSLKDLLVWREEEVLATELMRDGVNEDAPCYRLGRGGDEKGSEAQRHTKAQRHKGTEAQRFKGSTVETFYRLVFEDWRKKAYIGFPMTHVADLPEVNAEIANFRTAMKEHFICFDPGDLEESRLLYYAKKAVAEGKDYVEITSLGRKVRFSTDELKRVEADINSQIYARDFALIDQADMIISYIAKLPGGRAAVSSGVERELQHAHEAAKEVYVIWPANSSPSVFITQTATKVFKSTDAAIRYFESKGYIR